MHSYGFFRVAASVPLVQVGDAEYNTDQMLTAMKSAAEQGSSLIVFPELSVCAYTCADLLLNNTLLQSVQTQLQRLAEATQSCGIAAFVGAPIAVNDTLYNCAVFLADGKIKGIVPKTFLPNYSEFYELRWFASADTLNQTTVRIGGDEVPIGTDLLFLMGDAKIAAEICEDLWTNHPPAASAASAGANIICNLSASNAVIGKKAYRSTLVKARSFASHCAYMFCSAGVSESSTDTLYSGHCLIAENGTVLAQQQQTEFQPQTLFADVDLERIAADRRRVNTFLPQSKFQAVAVDCPVRNFKLRRSFSPTPFIPSSNQDERMQEIFSIQALSLAKRLLHTGLSHPVVGVSGGLDSTLALLVCVRAVELIGRSAKDIIGVTMPGFGTTNQTHHNAKALMAALGVTIREIDITAACRQHFSDIAHDESQHDVTYENTQARERTQILLDIANQCGGLVVGTGDLSELALGWATYAGDHISMYAVNSGVPKTLVKHIVQWEAQQLEEHAKTILLDILETPISPELLPPDHNGQITQKTEKVVGDYLLHDFFLYYFIRFGFSIKKIRFLAKRAFEGTYSEQQIDKCLRIFVRRFFSQQFKRSCLPDGPKVGSVTLSPRSDWKMPSDCSPAIWINELESF